MICKTDFFSVFVYFVKITARIIVIGLPEILVDLSVSCDIFSAHLTCSQFSKRG